MATKRDLVEAHSFNRRRLVTAFLSGAPGGREVEPVRYGRALVGGAVLAALLVAGAAVVGVLRPAVGDDWKSGGLVIAEDSGSRFVMNQGTLFPVINTTSARLILAEGGKMEVFYVPDKMLVDEPKAQPVGIPGAPDYLTPEALLIQDGWTACTNTDGGLTVDLRSKSVVDETAEDTLLTATSDKKLWLISGNRRYAVPNDGVGQSMLRGVEVRQDAPFVATGAWLRLVPAGTTLAPLKVPGAGEPFSGRSGVDGLDVVGTPVKVGDAGYVLGDKGLIRLSDFAFGIYTATSKLEVQNREVGEVQSVPTQSSRGIVPADWPTDVPNQSDETSPCLKLKAQADGSASRVVLASTSDSEARATSDERRIRVEQGRGALVRSTARATATRADTTFLVDARGTSFAIGPKNAVIGTLERLGYDGDPIATPQAWVDLFATGPELSGTAAVQDAGGATK